MEVRHVGVLLHHPRSHHLRLSHETSQHQPVSSIPGQQLKINLTRSSSRHLFLIIKQSVSCWKRKASLKSSRLLYRIIKNLVSLQADALHSEFAFAWTGFSFYSCLWCFRSLLIMELWKKKKSWPMELWMEKMVLMELLLLHPWVQIFFWQIILES